MSSPSTGRGRLSDLIARAVTSLAKLAHGLLRGFEHGDKPGMGDPDLQRGRSRSFRSDFTSLGDAL